MKSLSRMFSVDARSLGVLRIMVSLIIMVDTLDRVQDIEFFYTTSGVFPMGLRANVGSFPSVWATTPGLAAAWVTFSFRFILALVLLTGVYARSVAFVCFLLHLATISANTLILNFGDYLLLNTLLVMCLLPIGEALCFPAKEFSSSLRRESCFSSFATACIPFLLIAIYFGSALEKMNGGDWSSPDAVATAFANDRTTNALGTWFSQFESLIALSTYPTLVFEIVAPILLLIPQTRHSIRLGLVSIFVVFQIGLASTMILGVFPFTSTSLILAMLPSEFWNRAFGNRSEVPARSVTSFSALPSLVGAVLLAFMVVGYFAMAIGSPGLFGVTRSVSRVTAFTTRWTMFGGIDDKSRWLAVMAETHSGKRGKLLRSGDLHQRPERISSIYDNVRWKLFYGNVYWEPKVADALMSYFCRTDRNFKSITVYGHLQPIAGDGPPLEPRIKKIVCRSQKSSEPRDRTRFRFHEL